MFQPGDRLLTKRMKGAPALFSEAIAWWLHSRWSHVVPVISATECLNITWPKPVVVPIEHFFNGQYRIKVLRPVSPLTDEQQRQWRNTADAVRSMEYDLESFAGFIVNDSDVQDQKRMNCAEGTLFMDWSIGLLNGHDGSLISPQSYDNFTAAGLFFPVYEASCPTIEDFRRLNA